MLTLETPHVQHPFRLFPYAIPVGHIPHHRLDTDRLAVSRRTEQDDAAFPSHVEVLVNAL